MFGFGDAQEGAIIGEGPRDCVTVITKAGQRYSVDVGKQGRDL
jgi:hypothetical protein